VKMLRAGYLVVMAGLMPFIVPELPFQTTLFDWFNFALIPAVIVVLLYTSRVEMPLVAPSLVILAASLMSMVNARAIGVNLLTLAQEIYLFMLLVTIHNVVRERTDVAIFAITWMLTAMVESGIVGMGLASDFAERSAGTFLNPNMTGSYLGISSLFCFHPALKGRPLIRGFCFLVVVLGMLGTKSMSGILSLTTGILFIIAAHTLYAGHKQRMRVASAAAVLLLIALLVLPMALHMENFLDRLPRSSSGRVQTWKVGWGAFLDNPLGLGVGPGGFERLAIVTGGQWGVGNRMSLHSDYLAYLVERGILGFAGLLVLFGSIALMLIRGIRACVTSEDRLWMFALSAMFLFTTVDSFSHEMMHYRHVWAALGLMAAQVHLHTAAGPGKHRTAR